MARRGNSAHAVDDGVAAVGQADMHGRAADQADHHRLDHGQRELGGDGGIDGVAAGGQHLHAGGGGQRVVRHHHAAACRAAGCFSQVNGVPARSRQFDLPMAYPPCSLPPLEKRLYT